jgi:hypothetical protein
MVAGGKDQTRPLAGAVKQNRQHLPRTRCQRLTGCSGA